MKLVGDGIVLQDTRARKVRIPADMNGPSRLVLPDKTISEVVGEAGGSNEPPTRRVAFAGTPSEPLTLVDIQGESLASLTWPKYLAWRKTKCRPFREDYIPYATVVPRPVYCDPCLSVLECESRAVEWRLRALEEIDQAILEFIGEAAELSELFRTHGSNVFYGSTRAKLIDECGDCLFCGAWAMDAWGANPLYGATDLELICVMDDDPMAILARIIQSNGTQAVAIGSGHASVIRINILGLLMTAMTSSGLLANSYKKLRYQRREQDVELQIGRVVRALVAVNQILILANSNVEEALRVNMAKLDARYPDGYKPGQGGGIREGAGK